MWLKQRMYRFNIMIINYYFLLIPGQYNPGKYGDAAAFAQQPQYNARAQASSGFRQSYKY